MYTLYNNMKSCSHYIHKSHEMIFLKERLIIIVIIIIIIIGSNNTMQNYSSSVFFFFFLGIYIQRKKCSQNGCARGVHRITILCCSMHKIYTYSIIAVNFCRTGGKKNTKNLNRTTEPRANKNHEKTTPHDNVL